MKRLFALFLALLLLLGALAPAGAEDAEYCADAYTTTMLKLRKEPNPSAAVIDSYKKGTKVTVLEVGDAWCRVQVSGHIGYMMAEYLDLSQVRLPEKVTFTEPECLCDPAYLLSPGDDPIVTDDSYKSANISIVVEAQRYLNADIFVADIYVRSVRSFQRGVANNKWKSSALRIDKIAAANSALLAMTSDSAENLTAGWVILNGAIARKTPNRKRDLCVLYRTGEMVTIPADQLDHDAIAATADTIWQTFLFGPMLLDQDGKAMTSFHSDVGPKNPRSVIGYYEPGHYCFVQVDGRNTKSQLESGKKNKGLTLTELSQFMESLGCTAAYNLDGGKSSMLYFGGKIYSTPENGGRRLGDAVLIRELDE